MTQLLKKTQEPSHAGNSCWPISIALAAAMIILSAPSLSDAQTLPEALAQTYSTNPTLEAARAELRGVDEQVPQALSGWRPTLGLTGEVGKTWSGSEDDLAGRRTEVREPKSVSLNAVQPLYRGGRTVAAVERAENLVLAQRALLTATEQQVLFNAIQAYLNVLRDEAVLQLTQNNEAVLKRQLEAARDRFEVGEITRTDVAQAESRLAVAVAQVIAARSSLSTSRATYRSVIGDMPTELARPTVPVAMLPQNQEDAVRQSDENPRVTAAHYLVRAAEEGVDINFGELLPSVTLEGSLRAGEDLGRRDTYSDEAMIAARITVPLYEAGATTSRLRESKQQVVQARREVEQRRREAAQETIAAWESLEAARAQIISLQEAVSAATVALEGVRQEADVGARTILDVLDAEQELLDTQVSLIGAHREEILAAYQLLAAIGRLTAVDLSLPVALYDETAHYRKVRDKIWGLGDPVD